MKTLFTRKTIAIAAVALLIAIVTIVSVNVFNSSGPVTGFANFVSRPIRGLASQIAGVFESIYASAYRYDNLMKEFDELSNELAVLKRNSREIITITEENERLRAQLGFRERRTGYDAEQAEVMGPSGGNWSDSFTIDIGRANSSIERGNGVVTEYGVLIGQVSDVGATTSTVVTILDTTFAAAALIGDIGGEATMRGDFSLMRAGYLMLDNFDEGLIVLSGDTVYTSGNGGLFPSGLVVGEVEEILRHPTGVGRYATVKPMHDISSIQHVFIITDFTNTTREEPELLEELEP